MVEVEVRTKYDALKSAQDAGVLVCMLKKGVVPKYYEYYITIYEFYLSEKVVQPKHAQVITNVAEKFGCSEMTVYNIKNKMES